MFAVSLPYDSICDSESTNAGKETVFMLEGTMYFGLIFLLVVMVQSMEKHRVDWYRLIAFYLVGTLGVPLSNELGANAAGFNRFIGFGVLVHNMAEAAILAVIWRGSQNTNSRVKYFVYFLCVLFFSSIFIFCFRSTQNHLSFFYFLFAK